MSEMENQPAAGGAEESKADKFKRLSEPRLKNATAKIKLLGNLAGSSYEYTPEQVQQILSDLKSAVDEVEQKFQKRLERLS